MKRPISPPPADDDSKRLRLREGSDDRDADSEFGNLDENVLFEVLKHADARTLARCACVSKTWNRTSHDERLWEIVCTRHWPNVGCGDKQLRSVVLALGGFRRLYSLYLPLSKHPSGSGTGSSSSSLGLAWAPLVPPTTKRWGKDEVHLFLSLLSIRCYEKMNFSSRGRELAMARCVVNCDWADELYLDGDALSPKEHEEETAPRKGLPFASSPMLPLSLFL